MHIGLSKRTLLSRAQEFADRMMSAFDTTTGIPKNTLDLGANATMAGQGHSSALSELGTIQVRAPVQHP